MTAIPATVLWWCIKFRGYTTSPGPRPANTYSVRHTPPVRFARRLMGCRGACGGLIIHAPSTCLHAYYITNINARQYFVPK